MLAKLKSIPSNAEGAKVGYSEAVLELAREIANGEFQVFQELESRIDSLAADIEGLKNSNLAAAEIDRITRDLTLLQSWQSDMIADHAHAACNPELFDGPHHPTDSGLNTLAKMINRRDLKIDMELLEQANWTSTPTDVVDAINRIADRLVNGGSGPL